MHVNVTDIQVVAETEQTLFELVNQGTAKSQIFLTNLGSNTINYRVQEHTGSAWEDLVDAPDNNFYATLMANQTRSILLDSSNPRLRLVGNASGGSTLMFQLNRFTTRASGGALPILNY